MKKLNVRTEHRSVLVICLFVFAVFFVGFPPQAKAQYQPPDSCLKMICPDDGFNLNPDSVKVDSCEDSPTFGEIYSKRWFVILTSVYFFSKVPLPIDTIVDIEAIDSINYPNIKNSFKLFETKFSKCYIRRDFPIDSIHLKIPDFDLFFKKYQPVDSVIKELKNIDSIWDAWFENGWGIISVPDELKDNYQSFILYPLIAKNDISIIIKNEYIVLPVTYYLYDYLGNVIKYSIITNNVSNIQLDELSNGLYFIKIKNNTVPFIISR